MKKIFMVIASAVFLTLAPSISAHSAGVAVIVNKANSNAVDTAMIRKIYSGDVNNWPDGGAVTAIDLPEDNPVREAFSSSVLNKSISNMKAIWAQKIFSGRGVPPKVVDADDEVKKIVSGNKNAIGYIKSMDVDDSVKVILK